MERHISFEFEINLLKIIFVVNIFTFSTYHIPWMHVYLNTTQGLSSHVQLRLNGEDRPSSILSKWSLFSLHFKTFEYILVEKKRSSSKKPVN